MDTKIIALDKERILDSEDKKSLGLDSGKTYALRFLYNDKLNKSTDPRPFRINERFTDSLAKKVIGMPWIVPPKIDKHLKSKNYEFANPEELLTFQTQYSIGKFISTLKNQTTNNYYGIVEIKPEFVTDFNEGRLLPSPHTSITLGNPKYEKDGSIIDAEFLNLQTVAYPAYEPRLASINGVCNAGLKQCIEELAVLGASGKEIDSSLFSSISDKVVGAMSQETTQVMSPEQLTEAVQTLMKVVGEIKEKLDASAKPDGDNPEVAGAAGSKTVLDDSKFQNQINELKKELKDAKGELSSYSKKYEDLEKKERTSTATIIADKLIKLGKVKEEDKEETIKFYFEKQTEDGKPADLTLVVESLDGVPEFSKEEKIVAASGFKLQTGEPQDKSRTYSSTVSRLYKGDN